MYKRQELNTARMLHDLNIRGDIPETEIRANLAKIQKRDQIHLDELQEKAVFEAVNSGLLVITGGPGKMCIRDSLMGCHDRHV